MLGGLLQKILEKNIEKRQPNSMFMTENRFHPARSIRQRALRKWGQAHAGLYAREARAHAAGPVEARATSPPMCLCSSTRGCLFPDPDFTLDRTGGSDPHGRSGQFHK